LYIGHCIGADRLTEIDLQTRTTRVVAEQVGWPNSMSFGPDGRWYSPLNMRGEVVRWNLSTGEREVVLRVPTPPSSVKFDSQGRMLVTEFITGRLTRYDPNTGEKTIIADALTTGLDNVAIDSKGRMFIASNHNGGIMEVYEDGRTRELSLPVCWFPLVWRPWTRRPASNSSLPTCGT
jgi:sugar lactone lactonase YvrE